MEIRHHAVPNSLGIPSSVITTNGKRPPSRVRFHSVIDRDDAQYWISSKQNQGDFDYWIVIHLVYLAEYEDFATDYEIELMVIAPTEVPESTRDEYISGLGCDDEEYKFAESNIESMVMLLAETGCGAPVWSKEGNNRRTLYQAAVQEAQALRMLFGFYLDRPVNKIGTTGWDMLRGDLLAGLRN